MIKSIAVVYHKYPLYSGGSYLQEFVDSLAKELNEVVLIAGCYPDRQFSKPTNLTIHWLPLIHIFLLGDLFFEICTLFTFLISRQARNVDCINVISARGAVAAAVISKLFRIPVINTIEAVNNPEDGSWRSWLSAKLQKMIYRCPFDHTIFWSEFYRQLLKKDWHLELQSYSVIPGAIDTRRYDPRVDGSKIRQNFPPDKQLIVFAKPLYRQNREMAEMLVDACALLKEQVHLLVGSGEERSILEKKIKQLHLEKMVTFMPFVGIHEIPSYLAAADIIVLPYSYNASVSRSLLEAMAMGKPIITIATGEVDKVVQHGVTAYLITPTPEAIAAAVVDLKNRPDFARSLGTAARKRIEEHYSLPAVVPQYLKQFNAVVEGYSAR